MKNFKSYKFYLEHVDRTYVYVGEGTLAQGEAILNQLEKEEKMAGGEFLAADGNGTVRFMFTGQWDNVSNHGMQVFGVVGKVNR